jgi:hypothetical protein
MKKLLILLAFLPFTASASISADSFTSCRANPATSCTVAHTVTGSNVAGVTGAFTFPTLAQLTGCTWNGTAMTLINMYTDGTANRQVGLYYLSGATSGNVTCSINASTINYHEDESYTGVSQTAQPIASSSVAVAAGTTISNTLGGLTVIGNGTNSAYLNMICAQSNAVTGNDWLLCTAYNNFGVATFWSAGANTAFHGADGDGTIGSFDSNDTTPISTSILNGTILNMGYGSLNSVHINQ